MHLFCFGLGYVAIRLAKAMMAEGWAVAGTTRNPDKAAKLARIGVDAHVFAEGTPPDALAEALAPATHVVASIPPEDTSDDPDPAARALRAAAPPSLRWAGYLSSTGVYGDAGGDWVDEDTAPNPVNERAARRVAAEGAWRRYHESIGVPVDILRLAGIYGPGRSPLDQMREGRARRIVKPGQVFSRIHVDDIVLAIRACMDRPDGLRVFNICDDEPAPPQDVIAHACALLGVAPPPEEPFATADMSEAKRRFYSGNRRVSSARIKAALGLEWHYPTYRSGLRALAPHDRALR